MDRRSDMFENERAGKSPKVPENLEEPQIFEPKWKHTQEDLKYMFGIEVKDEQVLRSETTKKRMLHRAMEHLKEGTAFTLDYFINEGLLSAKDITKEDRERAKPYALNILKDMRNIHTKESIKQLFLDTKILTKEEVNMSPTVH